MEEISYPFKQLSKYVIAEIVDFLSYKEIIELRTLDKKFVIGVSYTWNRRLKQLNLLITHFHSHIENDFKSPEKKEFDDLMKAEPDIKKTMWENGRICGDGELLFASFKTLVSLPNPHGTIVYPIYFIWVLFGWGIIKGAEDDYQHIWKDIKKICRTPSLGEHMSNFDITKVRERMIKHVENIIHNHPAYLNFAVLNTASRICAHAFQWTQSVIECYELYRQLKNCSIKQIYDKIQAYGKNLKKMELIYDKVLSNYGSSSL